MKGFEGLSVTSPVNVKAQFHSDIRRFILPSASFGSLEIQLRTLFSVPVDSVVDLLYRDEEGDLVNMSSDVELSYAIQASRELLRVVLKPRGEPVMPAVAPGAFPVPQQSFRKFAGRGHFGGFPGYGGFVPNQPVSETGPDGVPVVSEQSPFPFRHGFDRFGGFGGGRGRFGGGFGHHHRHGHHEERDRDCKKHSDKGEKLVSRHVKDVSIPDGTQLAPKVPFVKIWRVRNEGAEWPEGTRLVFVSRHRGDIMSAPEFVPIEGKVAAGAEVDISVNMISPEEPGHYEGFWKMSTAEGKKFGQRLWVSIQVLGSSSSSSSSSEDNEIGGIDTLIKRIEEMGFEFPRRKVERLLRKYDGNVNEVTQALLRKAAKKANKGSKRH